MVKLNQFNQKVRSSLKRPEVKAGDIIKIHRKIKEGNKERVQVFEGIVISVKGKQSSSPMLTVRKVSFGVGVEITVPVFSPSVSKIEVVKRAQVRRSKLYYLRRKDFKISKLKTKELAPFVAEEPAQITPSAEIEAGGEEGLEKIKEVMPEDKKEKGVKKDDGEKVEKK